MSNDSAGSQVDDFAQLQAQAAAPESAEHAMPSRAALLLPPPGQSPPLHETLDIAELLAASPGASRRSTDAQAQFWRGAKWSPDGSHVLLQRESHILDLCALVASDPGAASGSTAASRLCLKHVLSVSSPSPLLSYVWYPFASHAQPATWCFAFGARDVPVRLVDAYAGKTRASYPIEDHVERFVGPQALAFSLDGTRLYAGHATSLSVFELSFPGSAPRTMALTPSRRPQPGVDPAQRGLVSALAVGWSVTSEEEMEELVAVGTFAGTVGIYAPARGRKAEKCLVAGWRETERRGVTQLLFHPAAPHILLLSSRHDSSIRALDLRYLAQQPDFLSPAPAAASLGTFVRRAGTSQRLAFDVGASGTRLVAGDVKGTVAVWDVDLNAVEGEEARFGDAVRNETHEWPPLASWSAAQDSLGAALLHPSLPLLLTVSGARHWDAGAAARDSSESSESESELEAALPPSRRSAGYCTHDSAARLWDLSGRPDNPTA
ncbi:hypothetical protein FA09DRAFT_329616 [Tilletiopsis washingtonensis]|uniref:WD40 repeat-like protein n=1 Tax=Tilletiopsis washingtonensis TaxID=58919 RepID=A0A316ZE95_9BASI|nr:hypothetical protein FA09DRAFT_329616 [Tilletiopsis washingtonensis]PWN98563.1 hypothetical protein FA09DRAFT_329616 [Tilletiopsis washingtonensis]